MTNYTIQKDYTELRDYILDESVKDARRSLGGTANPSRFLSEISLNPQEIATQRRKEEQRDRWADAIIDLGEWCAGRRK